MIAGYGLRDTGCGIRAAGCGLRDTRYEIRDTGLGIGGCTWSFFFAVIFRLVAT